MAAFYTAYLEMFGTRCGVWNSARITLHLFISNLESFGTRAARGPRAEIAGAP